MREVGVAAAGIANQRETTIVWDRASGTPVYNAIVWQDRRTAALCAELKEVGAESLVKERTGLVLDPYFSGTKFEWLLREREIPVNDDLALGTIDAWLIWNLTGGRVHVTDPTNASRTMLMNLATGDWDDELLALHEALQELAIHQPRRAQLVELRFFGGMTLAEVADFLGISPSSADRDWRYARAWLNAAIANRE